MIEGIDNPKAQYTVPSGPRIGRSALFRHAAPAAALALSFGAITGSGDKMRTGGGIPAGTETFWLPAACTGAVLACATCTLAEDDAWALIPGTCWARAEKGRAVNAATRRAARISSASFLAE